MSIPKSAGAIGIGKLAKSASRASRQRGTGLSTAIVKFRSVDTAKPSLLFFSRISRESGITFLKD
jgi:hypothetical protein